MRADGVGHGIVLVLYDAVNVENKGGGVGVREAHLRERVGDRGVDGADSIDDGQVERVGATKCARERGRTEAKH